VQTATGTATWLPHNSWVLADARATDLLYVSSDDNDRVGWADVFIFTYPRGELEGRLTGFTSPAGLCSDRRGNVFVTDNGAEDTIEYRHGYAIPIATLSDLNAFPASCSADYTSGNLAVANYYGSGDSASVALYRDAKNPPIIYTDPEVYIFNSCAYDSSGNLFLDGFDQTFHKTFAELPKNNATFARITLPSRIASYDSLAWDGKFITVIDGTHNILYRLRFKGTIGAVAGRTLLNGGDSLSGDVIVAAHDGGRNVTGSQLIAPSYNDGIVRVWDYPAGGDPKRALNFIDQPLGATVSEATTR
jgi:hypothetical protein